MLQLLLNVEGQKVNVLQSLNLVVQGKLKPLQKHSRKSLQKEKVNNGNH
jgi:hypothetical protein